MKTTLNVNFVCFLLCLFFLISCNNDDDDKKEQVVYWEVLDPAEIIDEATNAYLLSVIENSKDELKIHSLDIDGFNYEYGHTYKLKMLKTTYYNIQDDASPKYSYKVMEILTTNN